VSLGIALAVVSVFFGALALASDFAGRA